SANESTAAGHYDSAIHDIRGELRRRDLQRTTHTVNDLLDRLLDCLTNLRGVHTNGFRNTRNQVAALYLHLALLANRERRSDLDLDLLSRGLTDEQVVVLAHELHDRDVQLIATRANRRVAHDTRERDHRDLRGTATDVNHHVAGRRVDRQPDSNGSSHRFGNHEHFLGSGSKRAVPHGALLHLGDAARHADDHARLHLEQVILDDERQEVAQHLLGHVEVGNNAVLHWPNRDHTLGRAAQHTLRLQPNALDLLGLAIHRDNGRLVEHDSLAFYIDESIGSAEIYGDLSGGKQSPTLEERPAHAEPVRTPCLARRVSRIGAIYGRKLRLPVRRDKALCSHHLDDSSHPVMVTTPTVCSP